LGTTNLQAVSDASGTPFIPFKDSPAIPGLPGDQSLPWASTWTKMYHLFSYQRDTFLAATTSGRTSRPRSPLAKTKLGDSLRSKSEVGQFNEVLCKVIAHNLCVPIACIHEIWLDVPVFAPSGELVGLRQQGCDVTTQEDIAALLADAREQIDGPLSQLHDEAPANASARGRFRARVKSVLEQYRSALDYLAVDITNRYGKPTGLIYYPLAQSDSNFAAEMDNKMPGVRVARPAVADAIRGWQPYKPGIEWLRQLNQLAREQKHNRLTLQMVRETIKCKVTERATGAYVEWYGLTFRPGPTPRTTLLDSQGGPIAIHPEPGRLPAAPKPFWVGVGPTGVEVFGVPIDFATQVPRPDTNLTVESQRLDRWFFMNPHATVLDFLRLSDSQIRQAIGEIAQIACL
jgi:hypothetical protein